MAQKQIRKGFFFYFGLLVLLLFAVFMVCMVIMIFNPGHTILWMQYFTGNETFHVTKTTDENATVIDWASLTDLEINCTYADVTVERNNNRDYVKDGLYIINNAKGFAGGGSPVKFDYSVKYEGSKLVVDVTEPKGFLYFSNDIKIILHASTVDDKTLNFYNMNLTVKTTDGDVCLGGGYQTLTGQTLAQLKSADISTANGNISVTEHFDTSTLTAVNFKTTSGNMTSSSKVVVSGVNHEGLSLNCNSSFTTDKGTISFDTLSVVGKAIFTCKTGNIVNNYIYARDGISFESSVEGNYVFGEIYGDIELNSSTDTIISPNITIDEIQGNFVLNAGEQGNPNVKIGEISGYLNVYADKGTLVVGKALGKVEVTGQGGLSVDMKIADGNNENIVIDNKSGAVKLSYLGSVSSGTNSITTETGAISLYFVNSANFEIYMFLNNPAKDILPNNKIKVNIGDTLLQDENPRLVMGEDGGKIEVITNANINVNWVSA